MNEELAYPELAVEELSSILEILNGSSMTACFKMIEDIIQKREKENAYRRISTQEDIVEHAEVKGFIEGLRALLNLKSDLTAELDLRKEMVDNK